MTVNLAALLAQRGLTVGVLDADIGGFSIPRMLDVEGTVVARSHLESAFERLQQNHEPVTATAPANDYDQSRSNP